ncbi:WecB/TagA/CpsF family glycosyltransferase [Rhodococcus sp. GXMU-t2271]|uniref:WecB/TagA/CpsF family glycosyltransferase n=1 Tax=Rhodococcus sp. GXMU-t2271 TaxID=3059079 RepID=UPI00352B7B91
MRDPIGVNLPDGVPVAYVMRSRGRFDKPTSLLVRGPSLFARALELSQECDVAHFLFGTNESTLEALRARIEQLYPGARIAGSYAPGIVSLNEEFFRGVEQRIADSGAQLVWVALGTPKQDFVSSELARRLGLCFVGVGAAFDFLAGTVQEAPTVFHGSGFEWVYRLSREPRRLWRRYLFGNIEFVRAVLSVRRRNRKTN